MEKQILNGSELSDAQLDAASGGCWYPKHDHCHDEPKHYNKSSYCDDKSRYCDDKRNYCDDKPKYYPFSY